MALLRAAEARAALSWGPGEEGKKKKRKKRKGRPPTFSQAFSSSTRALGGIPGSRPLGEKGKRKKEGRRKSAKTSIPLLRPRMEKPLSREKRKRKGKGKKGNLPAGPRILISPRGGKKGGKGGVPVDCFLIHANPCWRSELRRGEKGKKAAKRGLFDKPAGGGQEGKKKKKKRRLES